MKQIDALNGLPSNQNRRRRQATLQQPNGHQNLTASMNSGGNRSSSKDYYYEDPDEDDAKGHRRGEDRIFKNSCSFGQFVLNPCLCLFTATISCSKRCYRPLKSRIDISSGRGRKKTVLLLLPLKFLTIAIFLALSTKFPALDRRLLFSSSPPLGRPLTDEALNQMPIRIPVFDFDGRDIGGWNHIRRFFRPTAFLDTSTTGPDFGGLNVHILQNPKDGAITDNNGDAGNHAIGEDLMLSNELLAHTRLIHPDDATLASKNWEQLTKVDPYIESYYMSTEDLQDRKQKCRSPNWAKQYNPNCNLMHELTLGEDYDHERAKSPGYDRSHDSFYISHGSFRDVWVIDQPFPDNAKSVLKMTRYKLEFDLETFRNTLNDALVMERLTGSPRIVDIFGHCGGTVWVEALIHEVEEVIVHGNGMAKQEDLPKELTPLNDYTVEEKLDIALAMAESLADLHGFRDGVIVHDDVQLGQWLQAGDGILKLGDFNRAEVMDYNEKEEEYCRYYNGGCYGNYRAPEEYDRDKLNEQIDVFSFGNNIYGLLTGLWVFYDVDDDGTVQKDVIKGNRAFIDPRWKERSFIESKMVEVMEKCWIGDINERIDIFGAVKELRDIKKEHQRRKT